MKLGLVQYSPVWENSEESILRIEDLLKTVAKLFENHIENNETCLNTVEERNYANENRSY